MIGAMSTDLKVLEIVKNARLFADVVDGFLQTLKSQLKTGPLVDNSFLHTLKKRVDQVLAEHGPELASIGPNRHGGGIVLDSETFTQALLASQQEGMVAMMTSVAHGKPAIQLGAVSAQVYTLEQRRGGLRERAQAVRKAEGKVASQANRLAQHLGMLMAQS